MTLLSTLSQASFWHQLICLSCEEVAEEGTPPGECPDCGEESLVQASIVLTFAQAILGENETE